MQIFITIRPSVIMNNDNDKHLALFDIIHGNSCINELLRYHKYC